LAGLENLNHSEDINRAWENIKDYQNLGYRQSSAVRIECACSK
jgi:hypothetical protein